MEFDIHKFVWKELFIDRDGKTSLTAFIGFVCCMASVFLFVMLTCFYMFKVVESVMILKFIDKVLIFFGIGTGLIGVRSLSSSVSGNSLTVSTAKKSKKKCDTEHDKYKESEKCDTEHSVKQMKPLNETTDTTCSQPQNN